MLRACECELEEEEERARARERMKRKKAVKEAAHLFIISYSFFLRCVQIFMREFKLYSYFGWIYVRFCCRSLFLPRTGKCDYIDMARCGIKTVDHVEIKAIKFRITVCSAIVLCLHKLGE